MKAAVWFVPLLVPVLVVLTAACGGSNASGIAFQNDEQKIQPAVTIEPGNESTIGRFEHLTLRFNKSMRSISLSGSISDQYVTTWRGGGDVVLDIAPKTEWSSGELFFTVKGEDNTSKPLEAFFSFTVAGEQLAFVQQSPAADQMNLSTVFTFAFNHEMDTSLLSIGGSLLAESNGIQWNDSHTAFSISPAGSWSDRLHSIEFSASDLQDEQISSGLLTYTIDTTTPVVSIDPGNSLKRHDAVFVFLFDLPMDPASLEIGGDFGNDSYTPVWSTTTQANDTMTLSPDNGWTPGSSRSLQIDVKSLAGNPVSTWSAAFDVLDGNIYVSEGSGLVSNPGTKTEPLNNIQKAVDKVTALFPDGGFHKTVHVAEGSYAVSADNGTLDDKIILVSELSLLGGYSNSDWNQRDWQTYPAVITDQSTSTATSIFFIGVSVQQTRINGFHLNASAVTDSIIKDFSINSLVEYNKFNGDNIRWYDGVLTTSVIRHNIFESTSLAVSSQIFFSENSRGIVSDNTIEFGGVYSNESSVQILRNRISAESQSIWTLHSHFIIENNLVYSNSNRAILVWRECLLFCDSGEQRTIRNNTIYYNDGTGIEVAEQVSGDNIHIDNNIIGRLNNSVTGGCINLNIDAIGNNALAIKSIKNNVFHNCSIPYRQDNNCGSSCSSTVTGFEAYIPSLYSGNASLAPVFVEPGGDDTDFTTVSDNDWHLQAASDCIVREGAFDGAELPATEQLNTDYDLVVRTLLSDQVSDCSPSNTGASGWSIGAFEFDP